MRETAAQALAILLPYMPASSINEVQRVLVDMVHQRGSVRSSEGDGVPAGRKYAWQVRHSGLLGLKYFVAVQGDLVRGVEAVKPEAPPVKMEDDVKPVLVSSSGLLKSIVDAALIGLRDRDDDVRSAAAATLVPLADALVDRLPSEMKELVDVLWACLGDLKDDLASSVGGVMDLLGASTSPSSASPLCLSDVLLVLVRSQAPELPRRARPAAVAVHGVRSHLLLVLSTGHAADARRPLAGHPSLNSSLASSPSSATRSRRSASPSSTPSSSSSSSPRSTLPGSTPASCGSSSKTSSSRSASRSARRPRRPGSRASPTLGACPTACRSSSRTLSRTSPPGSPSSTRPSARLSA